MDSNIKIDVSLEDYSREDDLKKLFNESKGKVLVYDSCISGEKDKTFAIFPINDDMLRGLTINFDPTLGVPTAYFGKPSLTNFKEMKRCHYWALANTASLMVKWIIYENEGEAIKDYFEILLNKKQ